MKQRGWSCAITARPAREGMAGQPSFSATATRAALALARSTPQPAKMSGALALRAASRMAEACRHHGRCADGSARAVRPTFRECPCGRFAGCGSRPGRKEISQPGYPKSLHLHPLIAAGSLVSSGVAAGAVGRRQSSERKRLPGQEAGRGAARFYWMSPQKMSMFRSWGLVRTRIE